MNVRLPVLFACALLAGCAPVYESKYDFDAGWRVGTITDVGMGAAITGHAAKDCRVELAPEVAKKRVFARVTFQYGRIRHSLIVPVVDGYAPSAGDVVYVNGNDCSKSAVPSKPGIQP